MTRGRLAFCRGATSFFADHERLVCDHSARAAHLVSIKRTGQVLFITQVLCDPNDENNWYLEGHIDLTESHPAGPMVRLLRLGC